MRFKLVSCDGGPQREINIPDEIVIKTVKTSKKPTVNSIPKNKRKTKRASKTIKPTHKHQASATKAKNIKKHQSAKKLIR